MSQTNSEYECGICLDTLKNPLKLPCGHKFCSNCLDRWRSKYGKAQSEEDEILRHVNNMAQQLFPSYINPMSGDAEQDNVDKVCPLCRKKIPPSKEMISQLTTYRRIKTTCELDNDTNSKRYTESVAMIDELEKEIGDWEHDDALDYDGEDDCVNLPSELFEEAFNKGEVPGDDVEEVLDWLGPPPIDPKRLNAKCPSLMNMTLMHIAMMRGNSDLLSILLQYGADVNTVDAQGNTLLNPELQYNPQIRLLLEWGIEFPHHNGGKDAMSQNAYIKGNIILSKLLLHEFGGRRCELQKMDRNPKFNGKVCVVEKWIPKKRKYKIIFEDTGDAGLVGHDNLKRRDRTPTDCGYYISYENGSMVRRDFATKEDCEAYVTSLAQETKSIGVTAKLAESNVKLLAELNIEEEAS